MTGNHDRWPKVVGQAGERGSLAPRTNGSWPPHYRRFTGQAACPVPLPVVPHYNDKRLRSTSSVATLASWPGPMDWCGREGRRLLMGVAEARPSCSWLTKPVAEHQFLQQKVFLTDGLTRTSVRRGSSLTASAQLTSVLRDPCVFGSPVVKLWRRLRLLSSSSRMPSSHLRHASWDRSRLPWCPPRRETGARGSSS